MWLLDLKWFLLEGDDSSLMCNFCSIIPVGSETLGSGGTMIQAAGDILCYNFSAWYIIYKDGVEAEERLENLQGS